MRVPTLTTFFSNHRQPNHRLFVCNRVKALARYAQVRVVAPVPWTPAGFWGEKCRTYRSITDQELIEGLPTYHPRYIVIPKVLRSSYGDLYFWSLRRFMERIYRQYLFDILDVHWAYPDGYAGVALAKRLGVPVCVSLRGSDIHTFPKIPALRSLISATLAVGDRVIAVASSMLPLVEGVGVSRKRVMVLPNGIDTERFAPMSRKAAREVPSGSLAAWSMSQNTLAFGVGAGDFNKNFWQHGPEEFRGYCQPEKSIHDMYFHILSETGFCGSTAFVTCFVSALYLFFIAVLRSLQADTDAATIYTRSKYLAACRSFPFCSCKAPTTVSSSSIYRSISLRVAA